MSLLRLAFVFLILSLAASSSANAAPAPTRDWTILIFLNANNNLDPFSVLNMNEMEQVGSTDRVNVVVQITRRGANKTQRFLMKKDADPKNVTSPVVETMPKQDMGDHAALAAFIAWGMANYPAKHYMVDIWNHGSGWEKKAAVGTVRGISYDDSTGNHITTPQLGRVLRDAAARRGAKLDLIGYDACLMQMAEVVSEVADGARYQVGSEELEPGKGWPYDKWLAFVAAHPDSDGAAVGKALVEAFTASYNGGSHGSEVATLSLVDTEKVDALSRAADAFSAALIADKPHRQQLMAAIRRSQAFDDPAHHDLVDVVDNVVAQVPDASVKEAGAALKSAAAAMILANGTTGGSAANARGLAIWLPIAGASAHMKDYEELRWSQRGQWNEFLADLDGGRDGQRMANFQALFGE